MPRAIPMRSLSKPVERVRLRVPRMVPGQVVCDFCTSLEVAWQFPCETWEDPAPFSAPQDYEFRGAWTACTPCKEMIELGDMDGVLERWYENSIGMLKIPVEDHLTVRAHIRALHQQFLAHRKGDPIPV